MTVLGARITMREDTAKVYTDQNGYFHLKGHCNNLLKFNIEKNNYKDFEIDESMASIKYNVTSKSEFIEFKKPFYLNSSNGKVNLYNIDMNSKNFAIRNDTFIFYLDTIDYKSEARKKIIQELSDLGVQ